MTGGTPMSDTTQLQVRLLPNGHLVPLGATPDPDATWQVLGYTHQEGTMMGVVRAELGGASWTIRVEPARLERHDREVVVTLERQSDPHQEPLLGWIIFC
jgi:hypothetical protein